MKFKNIIYLACLLVAMYSCTDDEGNYDYTEINQIEVDIDNMPKDYSVIIFKDVLKINPILKNVDENANLAHLWLMYPDVGVDNEKYEFVDTISTERNLEFKANIGMGKYVIQYRVTDLDNGSLMSSAQFNLDAITQFSNGFYVLKETEGGNTEMDLIISETDRIDNLLEQSLGSSLSGKPVSFGFWPDYSYLNPDKDLIELNDFLLPISTNDMAMLRIEDMKNIHKFDDLFYSGAPAESPMFCYRGFYHAGFVTASNLYVSEQTARPNTAGLYSFPNEISGDEDGYTFHKSAHIGLMNNQFFDTKNGRFVSADHNEIL